MGWVDPVHGHCSRATADCASLHCTYLSGILQAFSELSLCAVWSGAVALLVDKEHFKVPPARLPLSALGATPGLLLGQQ